MARSHKRDNVPDRGRAGSGLAALVHDYVEELEIDGRSALTARRYSAYLDNFLDWLALPPPPPRPSPASPTTSLAWPPSRPAAARAGLPPRDIPDERLREYRLYLS